MKRIILSLFIVLISSAISAQTTKLVFGPLEGDSAGTIVAAPNDSIALEVWVRTAPGINIVALHLPLSSNDLYIQDDSREAGDLLYPFNLWDDVRFLGPNNDPGNDGYTNQSLWANKDFDWIPFPTPDNGINTDGEWWMIAIFLMTTVEEVDNEIHYDTFILGNQDCNGDVVLVDFDTFEMDDADIEFSFAPLMLGEVLGVDDDIDLPDGFALSQNYPNPFNAKTTIGYDLPERSDVRIDIYNILGAKIATLIDETKPAGSHSVIWDAEDVSSGVYLYKIRAGEFTESRLSVLLK
ncbi:MAG: T9SS type A sorting domain-containing protein [candidate division Zixibacteria bacterium]